MNYILFDSHVWENLKPLTFTRPVAAIRCGILTIIEKWNIELQSTCSYKTQSYLQEKFPMHTEALNVYIDASYLPSAQLCASIQSLCVGQALYADNQLIAFCTNSHSFDAESIQEKISVSFPLNQIRYPWDIFSLNAQQINQDFELITANKQSQPISTSNSIIGEENIFIEQGARVEFATINALNGKVYIGKHSEIMEGALIRGPFALGEHATIKMGAKIYEGTTIGPHCKVGGEVQNSVLFAYSNKGHDGYLGNSVVGEWCNLGADTNNSNLKNDYSEVKVWNYPTQRFMKTGLQFCGLFMGDHSKSAINTMFNTGTVVGVSSNVFGSSFPRNFFPSFSWGGSEGMTEYALSKAHSTAERVYARRGMAFTDIDYAIFEHIFQETSQFRRF